MLGPRPQFKIWECVGAALALLAAFHFLALRVRAGGLPAGDEGSWLSVAAELARGQGFSTRWLEAHFLLPYTLPRPDDFRYPALTSLLALVFKVFGFSVEAGRWTVATLYLAFLASLWLLCRSAFGRWTGLAALCMGSVSLLQLQWNSAIYTEGLFGLVIVGLAAWCMRGPNPVQTKRRRAVWWAGLGAGVALLYLVRANGILFFPGIAVLWWQCRKTEPWPHLAASVAAFFLVAGPWMIRSLIHFGSPFHIAGNAGMLREAGQSHTFSIAEYFSEYEIFFPLQRLGLGFVRFFETLHFFEHGLEVVPLCLLVIAIWYRIRFFNSFLLSGFLLTFVGCTYVAFNSWAGVRYMSGLLPLVYAYGLSAAPIVFYRLVRPRASALAYVVGTMGMVLLLLPVVAPHRFYERKYSQPNPVLGVSVAEHLTTLASHLPLGGRYFAGSLCKVNFISEGRDCVGLQELYDSSWFSRSMQAFHPRLIVLTHAETKDTSMQEALALMRTRGYAHDTLTTSALGVFLVLRKQPTAKDPTP